MKNLIAILFLLFSLNSSAQGISAYNKNTKFRYSSDSPYGNWIIYNTKEIGKMEIAGGTYAVAHFEIDATQFEQAWDWVYSKWLPSSGYQPDENQCFELYPKAPENGRFTVDICIPVRPL